MEGTICIFHFLARVLIDPGSMNSFISHVFASQIGIEPQLLDFKLCVGTPVGAPMVTELVCKSCIIWVGDQELTADLILLQMSDFDVILGMDWIAMYHANVDCFSKIVTFRLLGQSEFQFEGTKDLPATSLISAIGAHHLILEGCYGFLAHLCETQGNELMLEDIPVVREFPDVFPEDLLGLPLVERLIFTLSCYLGQLLSLRHLIDWHL